jgi:hypothetical protein
LEGGYGGYGLKLEGIDTTKEQLLKRSKVEGRHKDTKEEQLSKKLELEDTYMEKSKIHRRVCRGIDKLL